MKAFKAVFEHRHLSEKMVLPKEKIWGIVGGGAPATSTKLQTQQVDFKKYYGQDLLKSHNNGDIVIAWYVFL